MSFVLGGTSVGLADFEQRLFAIALDWLTRFIDAVREAIIAFARAFGMRPDPTGVYASTPLWNEGVDRLMDELEDITEEARDRAWGDLRGLRESQLGPISSDAFVMAGLANSRNLLVRIPDEVYQLVFAEITDGVNDGESIPELTDRIDKILITTGSERWVNRARLIAITEANRASNMGIMTAGLHAERIERIPLFKEWVATNDQRVRPSHHEADNQMVLLSQPFQVGMAMLMFPGDPTGLPEEVINCRCSLSIHSNDGE